jgi:hypothetical protein
VLLTQIWIISSARRGVGKTYLAEHLCRLLPSAVYAEKDRRRERRGGPANCFTNDEALKAFISRGRRTYRHIVIETRGGNSIDGNGIHIFLDVRTDRESIRREAGRLKRFADICIGNGESEEYWREVLEGRLTNNSLVDTIMDLLLEQERFCNGGKAPGPGKRHSNPPLENPPQEAGRSMQPQGKRKSRGKIR